MSNIADRIKQKLEEIENYSKNSDNNISDNDIDNFHYDEKGLRNEYNISNINNSLFSKDNDLSNTIDEENHENYLKDLSNEEKAIKNMNLENEKEINLKKNFSDHSDSLIPKSDIMKKNLIADKIFIEDNIKINNNDIFSKIKKTQVENNIDMKRLIYSNSQNQKNYFNYIELGNTNEDKEIHDNDINNNDLLSFKKCATSEVEMKNFGIKPDEKVKNLPRKTNLKFSIRNPSSYFPNQVNNPFSSGRKIKVNLNKKIISEKESENDNDNSNVKDNCNENDNRKESIYHDDNYNNSEYTFDNDNINDILNLSKRNSRVKFLINNEENLNNSCSEKFFNCLGVGFLIIFLIILSIIEPVIVIFLKFIDFIKVKISKKNRGINEIKETNQSNNEENFYTNLPSNADNELIENLENETNLTCYERYYNLFNENKTFKYYRKYVKWLFITICFLLNILILTSNLEEVIYVSSFFMNNLFLLYHAMDLYNENLKFYSDE
jgi:hypothetical protein